MYSFNLLFSHGNVLINDIFVKLQAELHTVFQKRELSLHKTQIIGCTNTNFVKSLQSVIHKEKFFSTKRSNIFAVYILEL